MRIALISFEFPPAIAIGGIGTYAWQAARMLAAGGCEVEVFAAGKIGDEPASRFGVAVHRFDVTDRESLRDAVLPVFVERHRHYPFEIIESPEIGTEGSKVVAAFPDLALVVKLHTPGYLVGQVGYEAPTLSEHVRFSLGALRRGHWDRMARPTYQPDLDPECCFTRSADEIAAPSRAIGDRLSADWALDPSRISTFPLPYEPAPDLLELPLPQAACTIGFLGRLEARKGIVELVKAIPRILRSAPATRFRFLGPSWPYRGGDMRSWIKNYLGDASKAVCFVGSVPRERLAIELSACDIMVFPSRWESFGLVCPEAMAAGRAVIGSSSGGMAEIIEEGASGLLVPPNSPHSIAEAVLSLVGNVAEVRRLGECGRQRVFDYLAPERILPLQIASYRRAIERARQRLQ